MDRTLKRHGFEWFVFGFIAFAMVTVIGVQVFDIIECKCFPEKAIYDYIQMHISSGG